MSQKGIQSLLIPFLFVVLSIVLSVMAHGAVLLERENYVIGETVHIDADNNSNVSLSLLYENVIIYEGDIIPLQFQPQSVGTYRVNAMMDDVVISSSVFKVYLVHRGLAKISVDKSVLDVYDQVVISVEDYSLDNPVLAIRSDFANLTYFGNLANPINFTPKYPGNYTVMLKDGDETVGLEYFTVVNIQSATINDITTPEFHLTTNKIEYFLDESVNINKGYSEGDLLILSEDGVYSYEGKDHSNILFVPTKMGKYIVQLVKKGSLLLSSTFHVKADNSELGVDPIDNPATDWTIVSHKSHFSIKEVPKFSLVKNSIDNIIGIHDVASQRQELVSVSLKSPNGNSEIYLDINSSGNDISINIPKLQSLSPGIYKLEVDISEGDEIIHLEEEFLWGLISVNTKKSLYQPGELAELEIVLLDATGKGVCGNKIILSIKPPNNVAESVEVLDTNTCGLYYAQYVVRDEGEYKINLNSNVDGNNVSFESFFSVSINIPYIIQRNAQSVIDPTKGNAFTVDVYVDSINSSDRLEIFEYVHKDITILDTNGILSEENVLYWDILSSSAEISYTYSVPLIWPYLYQFGPLEVNNYLESRSWYVAVDPVVSGLCVEANACINEGSDASTCSCGDVTSSNGVYFGSNNKGLETRTSNIAQGVINFTDANLIPSGSGISNATLFIEFFITDTAITTCTLDYSTDHGASWNSLDSDCTDQTTEVTTSYDLSSLTESQLESFSLNFTSIKTSGGSKEAIRVDYANITVDYSVAAGDINVTLYYPTDDLVFNSRNFTFNYIPSSTGNFINCSLFTDESGVFSFDQVNGSAVVSDAINNFNKNFSDDGIFTWNVQCFDDNDKDALGLSNFTFTSDTLGPNIAQISPADNAIINSLYDLEFIYNTTDLSAVDNCTFYIDGSVNQVDTSVIKNINQSFDEYLSNGKYAWEVTCDDSFGQSGRSSNITVEVDVVPISFSNIFYESGTSDYTTETAILKLNNFRDATLNTNSYTIPGNSLATLSEATSHYIGNNGAVIVAGTVTFSGQFSVTNNAVDATWKLLLVNSTASTLLCQFGDDNSNGERIDTGIISNTNTTCFTSDYRIEPTDKLQFVVNAFNTNNNPRSVTHDWDGSSSSFVNVNVTTEGFLSIDMTSPAVDPIIETSENFNISCDVSCSIGTCRSNDVYVQYNTSTSDFVDISSSGNLILGGGETNPHSLGDTYPNVVQSNFSIQGTTASVNNIRCRAVSTYDEVNGTTITQVTVSTPAVTDEAPMVVLTNPANGTWYNTNAINLFYNSSDTNLNIRNSTLFINDIFNQTNQTAVINGEINNYTISNIIDGLHSWQVKATDATNLQGNSSTRYIYVDTQTPIVNLYYPEQNQTFFVNDLTFNFSATDNLDDVLICNLTIDSVVVETEFNANDDVITSRTINDISVADHLWNVTCWDEANNVNTSLTQNFSIIDLEPTITLVTGDATWFNSADITLEYNASDNNEVINASLYLDGIFNTTNTTEIRTNFISNFTIGSISDGLHNWSVNVSDISNLQAEAAVRSFYVDTIYPNVNLIHPLNSTISSNSDITFNFTVTDNLDSILTCDLIVGGVIESDDFAATNGTETNQVVTNLADGINQWNITCTDEAGNLNVSETWEINISEAPVVALDTADNKFFNSGNSTVSYTPTDNDVFVGCDLFINDVLNQSNSSAVINEATNNFVLGNFSDGVYNWSVRCEDGIGLIHQPANRNFTIDTGYPEISLNDPADGVQFTATSVEFNFTAIDTMDTILICDLTIDNAYGQTGIQAINGSITNVTLTPGTGFRFWNVTCYDDAGNTNHSLTRNFSIFSPPSISHYIPSNGTWYNVTNVILKYNITDKDNVTNATLYINGIFNQSNQSAIQIGQINNFTVDNLDNGLYSWMVNGTDAQNLVGSGGLDHFYIDLLKPIALINSPLGGIQLETNNITFNFTLFDNLDDVLICNLSIDNTIIIENFNASDETPVHQYSVRDDGNYSWFLACGDEAGNVNITNTLNFSIEAPPNVTLVEPNNSRIVNVSSITFDYIPKDAQDIFNCTLFIDDVANETDAVIETNVVNSFSIGGNDEGLHNWTVECKDQFPDFNAFSPAARNFTVDLQPPVVILDSPLDFENTTDDVTFNFTVTDNMDVDVSCDLFINSTLYRSNINVTNNTQGSELIKNLGVQEHTWYVQCIDDGLNINKSVTQNFTVLVSDLTLNSTDILFNSEYVIENQSVMINATVRNIGGESAENFVVQFFKGDPDVNGVQIDGNKTLNLSGYSTSTINISFLTNLGENNIFIKLDPNDIINESIEDNNMANRSISVDSWHFIYGSINNGRLNILTSNNLSFFNWNSSNFNETNIFVADVESTISFANLQALGRNSSGSATSNDFADADAMFNITNFTDSLTNVYTDDGITPIETSSYFILTINVTNVPVANSSKENTNFKTGVLWDYQDDISNGEFDIEDTEDIVFITSVSTETLGGYGTYDYEIRVPATLREYVNRGKAVAFYTEIR